MKFLFQICQDLSKLQPKPQSSFSKSVRLPGQKKFDSVRWWRPMVSIDGYQNKWLTQENQHLQPAYAGDSEL